MKCIYIHFVLIGTILFYLIVGTNSLYANDNVKIDSCLAEANTSFTYRKNPIHPALIKVFQNSLADYRPPMITSVDIGASYGSNQYSQKITVADRRISTDFEDNSRFAYEYLGKLTNNIHVLLTWDISPGTGVFQNLTFVRFSKQQGYDRDGLKPSIRLIMSVVRIFLTKVRDSSNIILKENSVTIKGGRKSKTLTFEKPISVANPASVNCARLGGKLESITGKNGEYALCHLPDGSTCEEWKLFKKECP